MENAKTKKRAATLSVGSNVFLIASKFAVGSLTGSVSIISEAIHSFIDLLAAMLAFYSVKTSSEPADGDHQFGHGKFEDLSGAIEGSLILFAAIYIIYEAVIKLLSGDIINTNPFWGIVVMFISVVVNFAVSSHLFYVAKKNDSIALLADAKHLRSDIYTSIGVLLGLFLLKLTGYKILDPIVAIIVALMIIKMGMELCMASVRNLLDASLPEEEKIKIVEIIDNYIPDEALDVEQLKTRRAGADRIIEFTLMVPKDKTIKEGHDLCDRIEESIKQSIPNSVITIHIEPCKECCDACKLYQQDLGCSESKN